MATTMIAYHGQPAIKAKYLRRVRAHRDADALMQGYGYWQDGKGCAVGCTIHGADHDRYETELGIPMMLAHLEDRIFEGLPKLVARRWPDRFLSAIPVGADLSRVGPAFLAQVLARRLAHVERLTALDAAVKAHVVAAIRQTMAVVEVWRDTGVVDVDAAWSAESAARSAASAAWSAESAARSAESAARSAAWSAESAERSAAWSAESAERSAACAAWSAESAARSAASAAWSAEYEWMANTLLDLLRAAPVAAVPR